MSRFSKNRGLLCFYEPRTPSGIICRARISLNLPLWHLHPRFACQQNPRSRKKAMKDFAGNMLLILYNPRVSLSFIKSLISFEMLIGDLSREQENTVRRVIFSIQITFICRKIARLRFYSLIRQGNISSLLPKRPIFSANQSILFH